jgi:hypothetical protein
MVDGEQLAAGRELARHLLVAPAVGQPDQLERERHAGRDAVRREDLAMGTFRDEAVDA